KKSQFMVKTILFLFACTGMVFIGMNSCSKETAAEPSPCFAPEYQVSFSNDILPIIEKSCGTATDCHSAGAVGGQPAYVDYASFKLKVDDGKLHQRIVVDKTMPPSYAPDSAKLDV